MHFSEYCLDDMTAIIQGQAGGIGNETNFGDFYIAPGDTPSLSIYYIGPVKVEDMDLIGVDYKDRWSIYFELKNGTIDPSELPFNKVSTYILSRS